MTRMRAIQLSGCATVTLVVTCFVVQTLAADVESLPATRTLWHDSRVQGFPDPPPPYQVVRAYHHADAQNVLSVSALPGTQDLLLHVHQGGYAGPGRLLRFSWDKATEPPTEFLTLPEIIYGVAFHPNFETNGLMYVGCNGRSEALDTTCTRVLRYHVSRTAPYECEIDSKALMIEWPSNGHNGGDLVFGHDGMLYVSAGDGTSDSDAKHAGQDLTTLTGSMLRIDVDRPSEEKLYSVPDDNPFLQLPDARAEIWAYGLRNPWRISLDARTGDLWAGINGQDQWETAQVVRRGENYGWSITEGSHPFQPNRKRGPTPIVPPTLEHPHSEARSLTGGHVYYGEKFPALRGHYIYGDYSTGMVWAAKYEEGEVRSHFVVARSSLQISGFGIDHDGELLIADYGSGLYRLELNASTQATNFPRRLSETGIFQSTAEHKLHPGMIAYAVNSPLWSDGAAKERFIGLPGDSKIGFKANGSWDFPDGTVLVKTFSLPLAQTTSALKQGRIETRLMVRQDGQWFGYSYAWNAEQTDAMLVESAGKHDEFILAGNNGTQSKQAWYFPSRSDCMVCHSRAANFVLGLSVLQMNRNVSHGNQEVSQLAYLQRLGVFELAVSANKASSGQATRATENHEFELPAAVAQMPRLPDPTDESSPLELRARAYLHANCAHCHINAGGGNSQIDLAFGTTLDKTKLVDERPLHDHFGIEEARLLAPGHPQRSLLLKRLEVRGRGQMPPLASSMIDPHGVQLLREWIATMEPSSN